MASRSGGVTSPRGFRGAATACGVKRSGRPDLSILVSDRPAAAAGAFTTNLVAAAPVTIGRARLASDDRNVRGILTVSGVANAMTGEEGVQDNLGLLSTAEHRMGLPDGSLLPACTGVIGPRIPVGRVEGGLAHLADQLDRGPAIDERVAHALLTTDTVPKLAHVAGRLSDGRRFHVGGVAKGSGMIAPKLTVPHATTLAFLTSDVPASPLGLSKVLEPSLDATFNMLSIDGDTSTNDTVYLLANGAVGGKDADDDPTFGEAVHSVLTSLTRQIARDGEGATKLFQVTVEGAKNVPDARRAARAVVGSTLVKAALFGADPNVGRIACALGYSGARLDPDRIDVAIARGRREVPLIVDGRRAPELENGGEHRVRDLLRSLDEVPLTVRLHEGRARATAWGCDLSYAYVQINAAYRS